MKHCVSEGLRSGFSTPKNDRFPTNPAKRGTHQPEP